MSSSTESIDNEKKVFSELCEKFEKHSIEDIETFLSLSYEEFHKIDLDQFSDVVYSNLIETIRDKHTNYYQTYKTSSLYHQVTEKVETFIAESCDTLSILHNINTLSEVSYESNLCSGTLGIYKPSHGSPTEGIELLVKFDESFQPDISFDKAGIKYLRKLLQIAQQDMCLILTKKGQKTWIPIGYAPTKSCNVPKFTIKGPLNWIFTVSGRIVTYSRGKFIISKNQLEDKNVPENIVKTLSENLNGVSENTIKTLIRKVLDDKDIHGALFVFIDETQRIVVDRLCEHRRGIKVTTDVKTALSNPEFSEKHLLDICKIDGAVVFDKTGQLLSIGTILDGKVITDGDIGRGSRYNSTKTFVNFYSQPQSKWDDNDNDDKPKYPNESFNCIGLVISEDKYIDLFIKDQILGENIWQR